MPCCFSSQLLCRVWLGLLLLMAVTCQHSWASWFLNTHVCFSPLNVSHITICDINVSLQVNGYLPVVLLLWLILILPIMFYGVARHYEDRNTESDVQKSIIGRYFYYQASHRSLTLNVILFSANLIYLRTHTLSLPISSSLLQRAQFWIL